MKRLRVASYGLRVMNHENAKTAQIVKSLRTVTPAEAGVQVSFNLLDSRSPIKDFEDKFHGNDTF
jgi:hypothetical protein